MSARVLIVDDEPANRKLLKLLVEKEGHCAVEAEGGAEAISLLESEKFELVLLDMMMPGVNGMDVLRRLNELKLTPSLPVVVVTAYGDREIRLEALALGAIDFTTKPVDVLDLRCRLRTLLELGILRQRAADQAEAHLKARIEDSIDELPLVLYQSPGLGDAGPDEWVLGDLEKLTGLKGQVAFGDVWTSLVQTDDKEHVEAVHQDVLDGKTSNWHLQFRWQTNQHWVLHVGKFDPVNRSLVGAFLDIDETKQLESRYLQSQKMEAVGQLAGGIAHDFNNLLCAIIAFAGFARDGLDPSDQRRADIEEVLKAADRAAGLTRQLLTFSRRKRCSKEVIDLNERLCQLNKLLTRSIGEQILLDVQPSARPAKVEIDPIQFDQVVLNLAVNARDAMPKGGSLKLVVQPVRNSEDPSEEFVRFTMTDTGVGMNKQTIQRIFEPFFTTKDVGRGTGLGLATTLAIVEQAGGTIEVQSVEGQGTTFTIQWPMSKTTSTAEAPVLDSAPSGHGYELLVVEDEPSLRRVARRVLEGAGYKVYTAVDGEQGKAKIDLLADRISAVVSDIIMPKMGGFELAEHIYEHYPNIPVIFVTGYMDDTIEKIDLERSRVLWKPFQRGELLRLVGEVLGAAEKTPEQSLTRAPHAHVPDPILSAPQNGSAPDHRPGAGQVLFIDDDEALCQAGRRILEPIGLKVVPMNSLAAARKALATEDFEAIVLDINLPDGDGLDLLNEVKDTPVIIITGAPTAETARRAVKGRVQAYLPKPVPAEELRLEVRQAVDGGRLSKLRLKLLASHHGGDEFIRDLKMTEELLENALSTLTMHYQPIVRGEDHSIYGYEALLRNGEPRLSSPLKLMAAAEILGRVEDVGRAVRASVAKTLGQFQECVEVIFVNLHPLELNSRLLANASEPLLDFAPRIILEVTERASLETGHRLAEELRKVRGLGYRLAVDDLGEGYAGLSSLIKIQPDIVKIDMSLIRDLHKAPLKIDIVSAIVEMAHRAGIIVVGEGVEVVEERDVLVGLGCDLLQGYYLAKPALPFCKVNQELTLLTN